MTTTTKPKPKTKIKPAVEITARFVIYDNYGEFRVVPKEGRGANGRQCVTGLGGDSLAATKAKVERFIEAVKAGRVVVVVE